MTLASDWVTIRNRAMTLVSAIPAIGNVYGYERYAPQADQFLDLYKTTIGGANSIRAWVVTIDGLEVAQDNMEDWDVMATLHVEGWLSMQDSSATEQTFITLCQQVVMALANERDFGADAVIDYGRTRLEGPKLVVFPPGAGGVVCHYASITKLLTLDQAVVWT